MGRIKTQLIKRVSFDIFREHKEKLKDNFKDNRAVITKHLIIPSKKLRNTIAGYVTRLNKSKEE